MENKEIDVHVNINLEELKEVKTILSEISMEFQALAEQTSTDIFKEVRDNASAISSIGSFIISLAAASKSAEKELQKMSKAIEDGGKDFQAAAKKIGNYIGAGIIEGIKGSKGKIEVVAHELGDDNVIRTVMKTLEINSPSKVMKRIGGYITDGLGDGIKDGSKTVKSAMGDISDTVEKSAKKTSKTKFSFGGIAAVATVVATLVGYFVDMLSTNEVLSEKMGKIWEKITEALSPVIEVVTGLFDSFINGGEGTSSVLDTVVEVISNVATFIGEIITQIVTFFQENSEVIGAIVNAVWGVISGIIEIAKEIFAGVFELIGGFFEEHGDTVIAIVETVWGFISGILDGAAKIFGGIFDVIVGIFTGNGEKIKEGFSKIWEGIKGIFGGIGEFFSNIWDNVVKLFKKVGTKIGDGIGGAFKAVVNSIIGFAEKTINGFLKAINLAIGLINKIPGVEIKKIKLLEIPRMADGGMVEAGQMFIAREAGPELVGSFGSRAAVMNNNQIVESVSRGVYDAVRSAMGAGNGSYTFNITNQLDGKTIGKQVIKYHNGVVKQTGISPLLI